MANVRKSFDGRKRARTMEYIDSQVNINDDDESPVHIGENLSMSIVDETKHSNSFVQRSITKRISERSFLSRQISDMTLNRLFNETSKTTELKGRDHIIRVMKTTNQKPIIDLKNQKVLQQMIAKRQEKQQINQHLIDFSHKYGFIDDHIKRSKNSITSELIMNMTNQLENLKPILTKRSIIDEQSPLLKIVKLERAYNHIICYCQYATDKADFVLFLNPNSEQIKDLTVNKYIRIAGDSRLELNLPELGSVTLGITDIRNESSENKNEIFEDMTHNFDFICSCEKCTVNENEFDRISEFDLRSTFPDFNKYQTIDHPIEPVYDSFTLALMIKRKFDLRATIIIYNPDKINNQYIFIVRDGIGNCLEIILNDIHDLPIEIQRRTYIFHQIEYLERIEQPKESNRWPYDDYQPPKKLFCFRSTTNQVSFL